MRSFIRNGATYANAMATVAVFLSLSGVGMATHLIVKSSDIENDQVKSVDVRDDSLKNGGLVGRDIKENTLQGVDADTLDGLNSSAFILPQVEAWHEVGSVGEPDFNQGTSQQLCWWENYGGGHTSAAFFKDRSGVVHLKGVVTAEDGDLSCGVSNNETVDRLIFVLPQGYRPGARSIFAVTSNHKYGNLIVRPDGVVTVGTIAWEDALEWVSLDGITFRAEQ